MVRYSTKPKVPTSKSVKACVADCRVHYKNTYEVGRAIKGKSLPKAQKYLEDVLKFKRCVPFRKFTGCIGRTAQAKEFKATQGRWPTKSVKIILGLLKNAESNADLKSLTTDELNITHVSVQKAAKGRRRTYRAHGRINPFMSSPCHVNMILEEKAQTTEKAVDPTKKTIKLTQKQKAKKRLTPGTGH
eukprot:GHVR01085531.1.p1 GENE.GHVR01085531.1~~GHVR01085531.1.p1  ORF type:complete len:205 (+),score=27.00 GHVR01085531.1:54-617(+)